MSIQFKRKIEDFICEQCGLEVKGNGYTNHCPECLWSKHVDVFPGDRAETCGGLMEPIGQEMASGEHDILYRCAKCTIERRNKVAKEDNRDILATL
ncbi:MAG: RNHCP domain-containing protein [Patescibacteria group bacterium]